MTLDQLLDQSGVRWAGGEALARLEIRSVVSDSRAAGPGDLFVAVDGLRVRGLDFAPQAVSAGAVAVVAPEPAPHLGVPVVVVADTRAALGPLASAARGHPSRRLKVLAVTGTNGKTTTTVLAAQLLESAGLKTAAIGTLGIWTARGVTPGRLTTPGAVELQGLLAGLCGRGYEVVTLEASSHALDQRRLDGTHLCAAAWTNLSRDHLDYHGDEAAYAEAKARLFHELLPSGAPAFVNGDDPQPARMRRLGLAQAWSFGACGLARHQVAGLRLDRQGISLTLHSPDRPPLALCAPLIGRHNAANLVAAVLLCRAVGVEDAELARGARELRAPAGRLQPVPGAGDALVLVDYAHTPGALGEALRAARDLVGPGGCLSVVFGCGGDRDRGKRPEMGRVAASGADAVVLTSDNPRGEDPEAIIDEIETGVRAAGAAAADGAGRHGALTRCARQPDRRAAIELALGGLAPGDVVLIAGKGHERTQTIAGVAHPFDDVQVAAELLAAREPPRLGSRAVRDGGAPEGFAFDAAAARAACGGALLAGGGPTARLCTDSREVAPGDLFVALRGDRFDGHDFLSQVVSSGARGVVCLGGRGADLRAAARARGAWVLEVDDTLVALGDLARTHRLRMTCPVIGVTGSNGKTTTKELLALALSASGPVHATFANFNNRIGVPLTLAGLAPHHRAAVVEMGTSEPGEIAELARIAVPKIGVLTSISEAHLEGLGTLAEVAAEKTSLLAALPPEGVAIAPADEPLLEAHLAKLSCRVLRFGSTEGADVRLIGQPEMLQGPEMAQRIEADVLGTRVTLELPGPGVALRWNVLAALAALAALGENLHAASRLMSSYAPVGRRMRPMRLGGMVLIEDCYNANPRSTEMALQTLAGMPEPRVAVLGDMLELGPRAPALHARVGGAAMAAGVARLVALGRHADDYLRGAVEAGGAGRAVAVEGIEEAAEAVLEIASAGGTVLVKGSRGARMERVVRALQERLGAAGEGSGVSLAV